MNEQRVLGRYTYRVTWFDEDMQANGGPVPEPISQRRYSGNFLVRVPPEVRRKLALEAAEENVSLNRVISAKLSS